MAYPKNGGIATVGQTNPNPEYYMPETRYVIGINEAREIL
jgi:hypothetical protein